LVKNPLEAPQEELLPDPRRVKHLRLAM